MEIWTGLWTGLCTGLDWTGLDWTGLDWTGLDWTGLWTTLLNDLQHDVQSAYDDWQPVTSNKSNNPRRGKKKKKGKASFQNQQLQTENNDTTESGQGEQRPNEGTIIVGDSIVKGLRKDLLSRAAKRRVTVRSFPGATTATWSIIYNQAWLQNRRR